MSAARSLSFTIAVLLSSPVGGPVVAENRAMIREEARQLENPAAYSSASIRSGRRHYLRLCQICHGADGKALENIDFEATNLTEPRYYKSGSTDGDIFYSTQKGAGFEMPAFNEQLDDEQIWEVVNFIRSIGPKDLRPARDEASGETDRGHEPDNGGAS